MKDQIQCWVVAVWVGKLFTHTHSHSKLGLWAYFFSSFNLRLAAEHSVRKLPYHFRSSRAANGLFNSKGSRVWIKYLKSPSISSRGDSPTKRSVCSAFGLTEFLSQDLHSRALPSEISTISHLFCGPLTRLGLYREVAL